MPFSRRVSALRRRAAAAPTAPATREQQIAAGSAALVPVAHRMTALATALRGGTPTIPVSQVPTGYTPPSTVSTIGFKPRECPPGYRRVLVGSRSERCDPIGTTLHTIEPPPVMSPTLAKMAKTAKGTVEALRGIRVAEGLPSQTGIGPAQEGQSFWQQLATTGLEKLLGPATTPTRTATQPGVSRPSDDYAMDIERPGLPVWVIPAALLGGFLLLRR